MLKKIIRGIRRRGVLNSGKALYDRYWFELKYGLKMWSSQNKQQAETPKTNYRYEPVSHFAFNKMLKKIDWNFGESTFLDFGCGKGAAILLASKYNFKKYIGVECSPDLVEDCITNIKRFSKNSGNEINYEIICTDATRYEVTPEENVFYFFNPFCYELFENVLQNIEASLKSNNRNVLLLYFNAQFKDLIEKYGYKPIYAEPVDKINVWYPFGNYAYSKNC
jgi:SAM-dependent methyltransferase